MKWGFLPYASHPDVLSAVELLNTKMKAETHKPAEGAAGRTCTASENRDRCKKMSLITKQFMQSFFLNSLN